eukprot:m.176138 g.176138  ORF g.176138 m.176138 type:complete len:122 (-) comp17934_c0_seq2:1294-1659(-)
MPSSWVVLCLSVLSSSAGGTSSGQVARVVNKFGIGTYYPPGLAGQAKYASALAGDGGWVTILVPCGFVNASTSLPPTCPGFSSAQALQDAYAKKPHRGGAIGATVWCFKHRNMLSCRTPSS